MKKKYNEPEIEVIDLGNTDIITTSGGNGEDNPFFPPDV